MYSESLTQASAVIQPLLIAVLIIDIYSRTVIADINRCARVIGIARDNTKVLILWCKFANLGVVGS